MLWGGRCSYGCRVYHAKSLEHAASWISPCSCSLLRFIFICLWLSQRNWLRTLSQNLCFFCYVHVRTPCHFHSQSTWTPQVCPLQLPPHTKISFLKFLYLVKEPEACFLLGLREFPVSSLLFVMLWPQYLGFIIAQCIDCCFQNPHCCLLKVQIPGFQFWALFPLEFLAKQGIGEHNSTLME